MNASEALYGFAGWLTCRDEVIVMSARNDAAPAAEVVAEFIEFNNLPDVRDGWEKNLTHPPAKKILGEEENPNSQSVDLLRKKGQQMLHPDSSAKQI